MSRLSILRTLCAHWRTSILMRTVAVAATALRVPLDAEAEVRVRLFQRFHNAVLAEGGYF